MILMLSAHHFGGLLYTYVKLVSMQGLEKCLLKAFEDQVVFHLREWGTLNYLNYFEWIFFTSIILNSFFCPVFHSFFSHSRSFLLPSHYLPSCIGRIARMLHQTWNTSILFVRISCSFLFPSQCSSADSTAKGKKKQVERDVLGAAWDRRAAKAFAFGVWRVRPTGFAENLFLHVHVILEKLLG